MALSDPPDWVSDAVFYLIFPDRFARSERVTKPPGLQPWGSPPTPHGYQGGDLIGVVEHLDYLQDLGITALYFNPIFQSASNHRYHTYDYERVDPMLGGNDALRTLVDEVHARGLRIVLDGVFNHASRGFFAFHDILENGEHSPYLDWFHIHRLPLKAYQTERAEGYAAWWNLPALPKFNVRNPATRRYLLDIGRRWIDFGIDGWRLDVPNEIEDDDFWREFRAEVKSANPDAYIVGEVWGDASHWLRGDMWDATMNYLFTRACLGFFVEDIDRSELKASPLTSLPPSGADDFARSLAEIDRLYRPSVRPALLNLLDSHDMARFLSLARGEVSALRLATLFQMTYVGAPSIYYGDEVGLSGGHDPVCRKAFPWNPGEWDESLLRDFRRFIALRREHAVFRRGSFRILHAQGSLFVFTREWENELAVVALNTSRSTHQVDFQVDLGAGAPTALQSPWSSETLSIREGRLHGVRLGPRSGSVWLGRRS